MDLSLAKKVDAEKVRSLAIVKVKYPELFTAGGPPEEHLLDIAPYFLHKPQLFYYEPVYERALAYLTDYYVRFPNLLVPHFQYTAESWWRGARHGAETSRRY